MPDFDKLMPAIFEDTGIVDVNIQPWSNLHWKWSPWKVVLIFQEYFKNPHWLTKEEWSWNTIPFMETLSFPCFSNAKIRMVRSLLSQMILNSWSPENKHSVDNLSWVESTIQINHYLKPPPLSKESSSTSFHFELDNTVKKLICLSCLLKKVITW